MSVFLFSSLFRERGRRKDSLMIEDSASGKSSETLFACVIAFTFGFFCGLLCSSRTQGLEVLVSSSIRDLHSKHIVDDFQ